MSPSATEATQHVRGPARHMVILPRFERTPAIGSAEPEGEHHSDEGWLYLAAALNLATREIVGRVMRDHMQPELPLAALKKAARASGLIRLSDRRGAICG